MADGGVWVRVYPDAASGGLEGLGDWAEITAMTGDPKRYTNIMVDGVEFWAFEWTADGSLTTNGDKCLIEALLVSGGSGGFQDIAGAGSVYEGIIHVPADSNPIDVTPGAAGIWDSNQMAIGKPSGIGDFISTGISQGIVRNPPPYTLGGAFQQLSAKDYQGLPTSWDANTVSQPHSSSITGTLETYAAAYPTNNGTPLVPSTTGYGDTKPTKSDAGNGQPGVVIIRVPASKVTATGGWV